MFFELAFLGIAAYQGIAALGRHWKPSSYAAALAARTGREEPDHDHRFTVSTVNLGVSAASLAWPALTPVVAGGVVYVSLPVFKRGIVRLVRERRVTNDLLILLSMLMMTATGYVGVTALGSWFYFLGSRVQRRAMNHARQQLSTLFLEAPRTVWLRRGEVEVQVPLDDVHVGDVVVVRAGEVVPIDGLVVGGDGMVDQHLLTGEAQPVEKDRGDRVLASTVLLAGTLHVQTERAGRDTTTARITEALERAVNYKAEVQLKGERWADQAALPLLATAGAALVLLGPVPSSVVLASGIGNRMRLLGPLGTLTFLDLASRYGFLVKDGRALEQLRSVDTVLFDKTGTLTQNTMSVHCVHACPPYCETDVVVFAALAERRQSHPIARGILDKADALGVVVPDVDRRHYHIGYGIAVEHDGRCIQVGSARFLLRQGIRLDGVATVLQDAAARGRVAVVVAVDGKVAGAIELEAVVRAELPAMLDALRAHGVTTTAIVSGDHEGPTRALAEYLGVARHYSDVTPADKVEIVASLLREGRRVCFIGDGVNDAVAMKQADVSMSLHGASSFAIDAAQIVLMDADRGLANLGRLFEMAHALDRNLKTSLGIAVATAAINVNGALFVEGYGVLTAYAIKQTGLAAGLGNAVLAPRAGRFGNLRVDAPRVGTAVLPSVQPERRQRA